MNLALALAFAEAGIPIMPVELRQLADRWTKEPLIRDWRNRASIDARMIRGWWAQFPSAVPGIVLQHAGLVVVDCDRHPGKPDGVAALKALGELPPHPVVTTASGGEHHFFRQPDPPISFLRWAGGEVLGTTRFVVGYSLLQGPIPEFPAWLRKALPRTGEGIGEKPSHMLPLSERTVPGVASGGHFTPTQSVRLRAKYILLAVERGKHGNRNNLLHWGACRFGNMIGEGKIKPEIAEPLLIQACKANGLWREEPDACRATIISGFSDGIEEYRRAQSDEHSGIPNREHV
jgi:hypothetical protein